MDLFKNKKTEVIEKINKALQNTAHNTHELLEYLMAYYEYESGLIHQIDGKFLKRYLSINVPLELYTSNHISVSDSPCEMVIRALQNVSSNQEKIIRSYKLSNALGSSSYRGIP